MKDVLKVLRDDDTREALNLLKGEDRKTGKNSFVFRTPRFGNQQFFIAVVEDSNDKTKTQLATVSYKQTYYRIIKPRSLGEEQRKKTLESALERAGLSFIDNKTDSPAQMLVYNHALSITESKLLGFRSLPPYSKAILAGLGLIVALMTLAWRFTPYITLDMYETFLVLAGFSVLFDLLPLLRVRHKKSELY